VPDASYTNYTQYNDTPSYYEDYYNDDYYYENYTQYEN
jgi:hypothetical protein